MGELSNADQSKYIGWQGAFYNIAKIVATGGLVYLAGILIEKSTSQGSSLYDANQHAWMIIMAILSAVMVLLGIYHIFMLPSGGKRAAAEVHRTGKQVMVELGEVLIDFSGKDILSITSASSFSTALLKVLS